VVVVEARRHVRRARALDRDGRGRGENEREHVNVARGARDRDLAAGGIVDVDGRGTQETVAMVVRLAEMTNIGEGGCDLDLLLVLRAQPRSHLDTVVSGREDRLELAQARTHVGAVDEGMEAAPAFRVQRALGSGAGAFDLDHTGERRVDLQHVAIPFIHALRRAGGGCIGQRDGPR